MHKLVKKLSVGTECLYLMQSYANVSLPKTVHMGHTVCVLLLSFSPTYALIYIIKILSQAVTFVALFTPTCFDPYGSSSGGTAGPC